MNRKLDFDKKHITSLAEVDSTQALKILRMAVEGSPFLIYFVDKETYRVLRHKDADALLASFPNSIEIYPDGKPIKSNPDSFIHNLLPDFTKILSPNNVYFLDARKSKTESSNEETPLEWKSKVLEYADDEALKLYEATKMQYISQRKIAPKVAQRLEEDSQYWGSRGPFDSETVRKYGLKGWKFLPPKASKKSGASGANGANKKNNAASKM